MNTELKELLSYKTIKGLMGEKKIDNLNDKLLRAIELLDAIKHFERKAYDNLERAHCSEAAEWFPKLKAEWLHDSEIAKMAAIRLTNILKQILSEVTI